MPERYLGTTLGRFQIQAVVGSGGFAWVYRGYDPELDIPVAVKVLKPQFAGDESFETRFRREAATAAKLRHPNIIRVLGVGREAGAVYFAMDYLPQGLVDRLRTLGVLPESMLARVGLDVAAALAFAHREGVIHRDIKMDNILFDDHGNAIVADFGIARAVSGYAQDTGTNMVVGTPQYFSPEQARGLALDGRADIYSLGVTLFKAATGALPFDGEDWYEIARQHVEDEPPRPRLLNPALSRDMERVILTCLEKDPADRYPSGEALGEDLAELLGKRGESSSARTVMVPAAGTGTPPPPTVPKTHARGRLRRRRVRRLAARGALATAAASVLALVLVVGTTREGSNAAPRRRVPPQLDTVARAPLGAVPPAHSVDSSLIARADTAGSARAAEQPRPNPPPPLPPRRELRLTAPAEATLLVDGKEVARGEWRDTQVRPGVYDVRAVLDTAESCPWGRDSAQVRVGRSGVFARELKPRPCGTLAFDYADSTTAEYTVASVTGDTLTGTLPADSMLTLPAGAYRIKVLARYCSPYDNEIQIDPGVTTCERVRLLCEIAQ